MKIIKNETRIKRNASIGGWLMLAAVIILSTGLYFTMSQITDYQLVIFGFIAFIVGFIMMQIGIFMGNRWGGKPRPDEKLDAALKGLPGDFSMYHFMTPASHLLVGPAGIWVLIPYRQRGVITYKKNRWRVGGGGFLQTYMSIFGQEGIGRPDLESEAEINSVKKALGKNLTEQEVPNVQAALIFMNEAAEIQADGAPLPALKLKQLKEFMRQRVKERSISPSQLAAVKAALPGQ